MMFGDWSNPHRTQFIRSTSSKDSQRQAPL